MRSPLSSISRYAGGSLPVALLTAALLHASPLSAQRDTSRSIRAGETVRGELTASDLKLGDGSYADDYRYDGRAGDRIVINLRSAAFDAYIAWGTGSGTTFTAQAHDDDSGDSLNARLAVTVGPGARYTIRVNSLDGGSTGPYTLRVDRDDPAPIGGGGAGGTHPAGSGAAAPLQAGRTVVGQLSDVDPTLADNSRYDTFVYRGEPGERVRITARSSAFDIHLRAGRLVDGHFQGELSDDDGAGGTDARLDVVVGPDGTSIIEVNAVSSAGLGAYELSVEKLPSLPVVLMFTNGRHWILYRPVVYRIGATRDSVIVPAGFVTDFASIPQQLQSLISQYGPHSVPAVVHDYLYWTGACTKSEADRIFNFAMMESKSPSLEREAIFNGVRLGGLPAFRENAAARRRGELRVLPADALNPSPGVTWPEYQGSLMKKGVRNAPTPTVSPSFCAWGRSSELPPGVRP